MARPVRDPLEAAFSLGNRTRGVGAAIGVAGALVVHGAAAAKGLTAMLDIADFAGAVRTAIIERLQSQYNVDLARVKPEIETPEAPEEPEEQPQPKRTVVPNQPPPAPAEAGKVLAVEPDPDEPVDMTGDGWEIVQGEGEYRGGRTAEKGTSKRAVYNPQAKIGGEPGGTGTGDPTPKPPRRGPDRSASPKLTGGAWDCGFPSEADMHQVNSADAYIVVTVGPDGAPKRVAVTSDPGYGFGRLARACAMRKRFKPGLDRQGRPTTKSLGPIKVRFRR